MRGRALKVPALLLAGLAVAFSLEPLRYGCIGLMRGEAVYCGRPTSYWSVLLRQREADQSLSPNDLVWASYVGNTTTALHCRREHAKGYVAWPPGPMPWLPIADPPYSRRTWLFEKDPLAVPVLIELLRDERASVRADAALALGRIGAASWEAVPALTELLDGDDPFCRWHAAWALGQIGKPAQPAVPMLMSMAATWRGRWKDAEAATEKGTYLPRLMPEHATAMATVAAGEALQNIDPEAAREAGVPDRW